MSAAPVPSSSALPAPEFSNLPLYSGISPPLPPVHGAEPGRIALDAFRIAAAVQIIDILGMPKTDEQLAKVWDGVEVGKASDLQVAVPRFRLKANPQSLTAKLASEFKANDWLEACTAAGVFVGFKVRAATLFKLVLNQVNELTHSSSSTPYGSNTSGIVDGKKRKLLIEFSSPNIAKKFHAGHLRSTIIGAFLANLYEANGWEVTRMNYLGDWGRQFGILAVGFDKYGSEEKLKTEPIAHLLNVYTSINREMDADPDVKEQTEQAARDFFKRMEDREPTAIAQWKRFRDYSIVQYEADYARLGVHFDVYGGESLVTHESMDRALDTLVAQKVVAEDQGSLVVDLEKFKLGKTIVRRKDGTNLYITRDIGEAIQRWEKYAFDKMIYVVASQQEHHVAQFFRVLKLMGYEWADRLEHINFGMVAGMSTRKGTVVHLEDVMDEAKQTMHDQMKTNEAKYDQVQDPWKTADVIGLSGIKVQDFAAKRINGYDFNMNRVLSFEGDTGPYLQYAHVRLCSVERKVADEVVLPSPSTIGSTVDTSLLASDPKARDLAFLLAQYPDAVKFAFTKSEASSIVTYCWRLTHAVSSAWETLIVKGQPKDVALARLWLFRTCRDVLGSAMRLLTLEPLERM